MFGCSENALHCGVNEILQKIFCAVYESLLVTSEILVLGRGSSNDGDYVCFPVHERLYLRLFNESQVVPQRKERSSYV
jgi:hypothetical protein